MSKQPAAAAKPTPTATPEKEEAKTPRKAGDEPEWRRRQREQEEEKERKLQYVIQYFLSFLQLQRQLSRFFFTRNFRFIYFSSKPA